MSLRNRIFDVARQRNARRKHAELIGARHEAHVLFEDGASVVDFGAGRFFLRSAEVTGPSRDNCDFAVFGLLILSLTSGAAFRLNAPVSASMKDALEELSYCFEIWQIPGLFAPQVELTEIVDDVPAGAAGKIICLSGGVDSTSAAIGAVADHGFSHGLLIAGADYPTADTPGYIELREIVGEIARQVGLSLVEVETDLRKFDYDWSFLHGLNLGMCLSYLSSRFGTGAIAMDNTLAQDLVRHPWGNTGALAQAMSRPSFPILGMGGNTDRVQKIRRIADFGGEKLLRALSVCWENTDRGTNCGHCVKCIQTRLNFVCAGVPEELAFETDQPLESLIGKLPKPSKPKHLRGSVLRTSEFMRYLPDGAVKDAIRPYYREILRKLRHTNSI